MAESSTATQQLPSTSYSLNVSPILADIRVENLSAQPENNSSTSSSSSTQTTSNNNNNTNQTPPPPTTATAQVSLIPSSSSNLSSAAQVVVSSITTDSNSDNLDEPEAKRKKFDHPLRIKLKNEKLDKLENRLGSVLCCAVCLDLPKTAMYQCPMGHLMCSACFTHLLADGRLRDQTATCPNCRVEISKNNASRNLAVEKAVSELPSECQYCNQEFPRISLEHHETNECEERPTDCKYAVIGCQWKGPIHEVSQHETFCAHPKKSGADVMQSLVERDAINLEEKKRFNTLIDLLSYEKIIFNDLQLKPYRTDEFLHKLFYETSRFSAFNHQWVVKAIINNSQSNPHQCSERELTYQLILKSKTTYPLAMHYFVLQGPFSDMKVNISIYKHDFTDSENESVFNILPLPDSSECNRLLALKTINFRLIMFLASK